MSQGRGSDGFVDGFGEGTSGGGPGNGAGGTTKRGTRACVNCRKGKNRCEGWENPPCKRCRSSGTACIFEKPEKSSLDDTAVERVSSLENKVTAMQGTIVSLDYKLDRLLGAFSNAGAHTSPASSGSPAPLAGGGGLPVIDPTLTGPIRSGSSSHAATGLLAPNPTGFQPPGLENPPAHENFPPPPGWIPNHMPLQWDHQQGGPTGPAQPTVAPAMPSPASSSSPEMTGSHPFAKHRPLPAPRGSSQSMLAPPTIPMMSPPAPNADGSRPTKRARVVAPDESSPPDVSPPSSMPPPTSFPPLPKYPATTHPMQRYGLSGSTTASNSDDEEELVPSSTLTAPFEALAEAAAAVAAEDDGDPRSRTPRSPRAQRKSPSANGGKKRRKKRMPPPPNFFPHVVTKGIISDTEARDLIAYYFERCNDHLPFFDPSYDTYDSLFERTPFSFDSICMTALRSQAGSGPHSRTYIDVADEARGLGRSTLFSVTVRVEGVQASLVQAAWTDNGYLATGHSLRMGMELGLHRALGILKTRTAASGDENEERLLVVSARVWLALYIQDQAMSRGTGRPLVLRDSERPKAEDCRGLLDHPMSCPTDAALVADVDFIAHCGRAIDYFAETPRDEHLSPAAIEFLCGLDKSLEQAYERWDRTLGQIYPEDHFQRVNLRVKYWSAYTFLSCTALQGRLANDGGLQHEVRLLVTDARTAALKTLRTVLHSDVFRDSLRSAPHTTISTVAFTALLSLKMTRCLPDGVNLAELIGEVLDITNVLAVCPQAERFCVTIHIALEKFKRSFPGGAIPDALTSGSNAAGAQTSSALVNGLQPSGPQIGGNDFDFSSLIGLVPNDWLDSIDNPSVPDWLKSGDPLSLDFPSASLDSLFLPSWSLERGGATPAGPSYSGEGIAW